jgi:hypothetical protein
VLALVGGLGLVAAFLMPWFSTQGLLLSGQFLHNFLGNASATDLRRFLPTSSPTEVTLLRGLVDLFPACGAIAAALSLAGGVLRRSPLALDVIAGLTGLVALVAWAIGITQLPPGAAPEIGLWLMGASSIAVIGGTLLDRMLTRDRKVT